MRETALIEVPRQTRFAGLELIRERIQEEIKMLLLPPRLETHELGDAIFALVNS